MNMLLQYAVIGIIVLASLFYTLRKLVPQVGRWQTACAARLNQPSHSGMVRALGRLLQPRQSAAGCDSGCNTCHGCSTESTEQTPPREQPLTFHAKR
jgi:hypothetical protein